jgi:hypothetical protein
LAIPVLLILAVLWAAVLVPPVLRSRSETRRKGSVGDTSFRFGPNSGRSRRSGGSRAGRSLHAVPAPQLGPTRSPDGGSAENGARRAARSGSRLIASGASAPTSRAQKRRRNVLIILGGTALATLLLGLVLGSPLLWLAQATADVLLVVYLVLLVYMTRRGSLDAMQNDFDTWPPAARETSQPVAHPRVPPRRELAPLAADSSLPRVATK